MNIAFIGLGNMGFPIAKNLLEAGFHVNAYNRSYTKANALKVYGAEPFETPQEAVAHADVVITMLSDDQAVTEISTAIVPAMKPSAIHLSMSTIAPSIAQQLHQLHAQHQIEYVASPVLGRPPAAEAKQLFVLLSGSVEAKEKVAPIIQAISQRSFDFGTQASAAHQVKVMVNFMVFATVELLSEVMISAENGNIDKTLFLETITNTIFGAPAFTNYGNLILREEPVPNGFTTKLAAKDLHLMQKTASETGLRIPMAELIQKHFTDIISAGNGQQDVSLLVSHLRKIMKSE